MADDTHRTDSSSAAAAPQGQPAKSPDDPVWSLVYWGGATAAAVAFGLWCIYDGWISETVSESTQKFSQWATPVCFLAALYVAWRGRREYRDLKAKAQGQGGPSSPDAKPNDQSGDAR